MLSVARRDSEPRTAQLNSKVKGGLAWIIWRENKMKENVDKAPINAREKEKESAQRTGGADM